MCSLERNGDVFILTITGDGEHRLNPELIDSIRTALARARSESTRCTALITTAQGKFFSNGYDLSWALSDPDPLAAQARLRPKIMSKKLRLLVEEFISLPMPTIAAVNGHASAAGFILALSHDYLLMRKDRGYLYMSELDIKYDIPRWFVQIVKNKIGSPKVWRSVVMTSAKISAVVGVEWGIVDSAHGSAEETLDAAVKLGADLVRRNWDGKVYATTRRVVFAEVLAVLAPMSRWGTPAMTILCFQDCDRWISCPFSVFVHGDIYEYQQLVKALNLLSCGLNKPHIKPGSEALEPLPIKLNTFGAVKV